MEFGKLLKLLSTLKYVVIVRLVKLILGRVSRAKLFF